MPEWCHKAGGVGREGWYLPPLKKMGIWQLLRVFNTFGESLGGLWNDDVSVKALSCLLILLFSLAQTVWLSLLSLFIYDLQSEDWINTYYYMVRAF